jgi:hypothetical protein
MALDDAAMDLGVVALAAGALVVGVDVDDRRAGLGAGDAFGHQLADRDLQGAPTARSTPPRARPSGLSSIFSMTSTQPSTLLTQSESTVTCHSRSAIT